MRSIGPCPPRSPLNLLASRAAFSTAAALAVTLSPAWSQQTENTPEAATPPPTKLASVEPESQPEPESEAPALESPAPAAVSIGGLRVFVDPETGEILTGPRPEQIRTLEALERQRVARSAVTGEPETVRLFAIPGGVGADLPPSTMSSMVVRVRPDGTLETVCVDHSDDPSHVHPEEVTTTSKSQEEVR